MSEDFEKAMKGLQAEVRRLRVTLTAAEGLLSPAVREVARAVRDAGEPDRPSLRYAAGAVGAMQAHLDGAGREALVLAAVRCVLAIQALDAEEVSGG
jgi:hypothetical protein